jgi:hypothetical protein
MVSITSHQENANQNCNEISYIVTVAIIKKKQAKQNKSKPKNWNSKVWLGCEETGTHICSLWDSKLVEPYGEDWGSSSKN